MYDYFRDVRPQIDPAKAELIDMVLNIAVELAREGREGRKVGTLFTIGDEETVLKYSRPLILDPLFGHHSEKKHVSLPDVRETIKELSQLDGAFVISGTGIAISAARYIDVLSDGVKIPLGLGSRHMAAASITLRSDTIAIVVSESSVVRVFKKGKIVAEILHEIWLMKKHGFTVTIPMSATLNRDQTVESEDLHVPPGAHS